MSHIHILQKMALRLIINVPKLTHSAPLLRECQIMPIKERTSFRTVAIDYKTLNGLTPSYMLDLFKLQTDVLTRVTRFNQKNKLYVPKYKFCVQFNQLPCDTQEYPSLKSLKCKAFKHFMQSAQTIKFVYSF